MAARLLGDRRFEVQYEPPAAGGGRGPDFAVAFRINQRLTLEVTRPRQAGALLNTLCAKTGQLPAGVPNALVLAAPGLGPEAVPAAALDLQRRAARKEDAFFRLRGHPDPRGYLRAAARLSAVFVLGAPAGAVWRNGAARHPLAGDLVLALERRLGADNPLTVP